MTRTRDERGVVPRRQRRQSPARAALAGAALLAVLLAGCEGDQGPAGPPGPGGPPSLDPGQPLPGVVVAITAIRGGRGVGGNFAVGDTVTVEFTLADDAGAPLQLADMTRGAAMVSGPTFQYQRVIGEQTDVLARAVATGAGRYRYTFPVPLPATFLPPLHKPAGAPNLPDELTGQPLLGGTYTVGLEFRRDFTAGGATIGDVGNAVGDFLFGSATILQPREVVAVGNCNQCHGELRAHGENQGSVRTCLLCHTAGAGDATETPQETSIEFKVMIHKIHAGADLPSVLGVATNPDGTRNYAAAPRPYQLVDDDSDVHDFSQVHFPVWPSLTLPMPRDFGYDALPAGGPERAKEDAIRSGPVACDKCHGDPDGPGPLPAPAQGEVAFRQPTRRACGSCHDDWLPTQPYRSNNSEMPPQTDESRCTQCHPFDGTPLSVRGAHRHPLTDPAIATGVVFDLQRVDDVGNGNGRFETGEKVRLTFTIHDDAGQGVPATSLANLNVVLQGPTTNPNLVHYTSLAPAGLGSGPTYVVDVPETVAFEPIGTSTAGAQTFQTARAPHWNVPGAATFLFLRTATGASTVLASDAVQFQNQVDVVSAAGIQDGDVVVIDDGAPAAREYARVRLVDVTAGRTRLWFSSPYSPTSGTGAAARPTTLRLEHAHGSGATVTVVTLADIPAGSYTLDPLTGTVQETTEFGNGEVLASYTTDFVLPSAFRGTLDDSPDIAETGGDWRGLLLPAGTYTLGIFGAITRTVDVLTQLTTYTEGSRPATANLLFGDATTITEVARISDPANCTRCHDDVRFHGGGRRGVETCLLCHGLAGAEDAPRYVYPAAEATPGVAIEFRAMLHKIHHGHALSAGAGYQVVGFGGQPHSYETVVFPAMPGGTKDCAFCHGAGNTAWILPADRSYGGQVPRTRAWGIACGSCHDSLAAATHIDLNTSTSGAEACAVCHGAGRILPVEIVHQVR